MKTSTGLSEKHFQGILQSVQQDEVKKAVGDVYRAITKYIHPQIITLVTLTSAVKALRRKDFGIFKTESLEWVPISIVGEDGALYQTPVTKKIYDALAPVFLSDIARNAVKQSLQSNGLNISFFCNGNFVLGETEYVRAFSGSFEYVRRERIYSSVHCTQYPTIIDEIGIIKRAGIKTIDLSPCGAEERLFEEIEKICNNLDLLPPPSFEWIPEEIKKSLRWINQK